MTQAIVFSDEEHLGTKSDLSNTTLTLALLWLCKESFIFADSTIKVLSVGHKIKIWAYVDMVNVGNYFDVKIPQ